MKTGKMTFGIIVLWLVFVTVNTVSAQTTAFNFQGFLNDGGTPATGRYDLRFKLFDALTSGGQVGATFDRPNLMLINGVFSTVLDFGPNAFVEGESRFLEISVRPAGSPNAYVVLGARQQILSVPYSIKSIYSAFSSVATNATNATNANIAQNANALGGVAATEFFRRNFDNTGDLRTTGNLTVNGNALQSLSANGFVKAMIYVSGTGSILSCYNGVTGVSTGNCGFNVQEAPGLVGVYNIDFGFAVAGRFVSLTAEYGATQNKGANFKFVTSTRIDVFTFFADDPSDTARTNFMLILY